MDPSGQVGSLDRRHPGHSISKWPSSVERRNYLAAWADSQVAEGDDHDDADASDHDSGPKPSNLHHVIIHDDDNYELRSSDSAVRLYYIDGKTHVIFHPNYEPSFVNNLKLVNILKQHDHVLSTNSKYNAAKVLGEDMAPPARVQARHFVQVTAVLLAMFILMAAFAAMSVVSFKSYLHGNRQIGCDNNRKMALVTHTTPYKLCKGDQ